MAWLTVCRYDEAAPKPLVQSDTHGYTSFVCSKASLLLDAGKHNLLVLIIHIRFNFFSHFFAKSKYTIHPTIQHELWIEYLADAIVIACIYISV